MEMLYIFNGKNSRLFLFCIGDGRLHQVFNLVTVIAVIFIVAAITVLFALSNNPIVACDIVVVSGVLGRGAYNFSIAVYDTDTQKLYYLELDT